jgi:hypothetical protein
VVVANPMWNQPFGQELFANDPFDRFRPSGGFTTGRGVWAWLQHTLELRQKSALQPDIIGRRSHTGGAMLTKSP